VFTCFVTHCVQDLSHRGIIKVSYDLGYATQTKSLLVEGHTSAKDVVEQLVGQLKLGGAAVDYCLEERNHMSGGMYGVCMRTYTFNGVDLSTYIYIS